jgi:hypothetical protein
LFAQAQISHWEENLERLQVEQFRLRCYMASLQAGELPNPKVKEYFLGFFSLCRVEAEVLKLSAKV